VFINDKIYRPGQIWCILTQKRKPLGLALSDVACAYAQTAKVTDALKPFVKNVYALTPHKLPDTPITKAAAFRNLLSDAQRQVRMSSRTWHAERGSSACLPACLPACPSYDTTIDSYTTSTMPFVTSRQIFRPADTWTVFLLSMVSAGGFWDGRSPLRVTLAASLWGFPWLQTSCDMYKRQGFN
jgi:hypothetical protein